MPRGVWALEWLNENSQRRYPLSPFASGWDLSGSFELPRDFLVELYLSIGPRPGLRVTNFHVMEVVNYSSEIRVVVGYTPEGGEAQSVAEFALQPDQHEEYGSYTLSSTTLYPEAVGVAVVGSLEAMREQPYGRFDFDLNGGQLDPDCIRLGLPGVYALVVQDGENVSAPLRGVVTLEAGENVTLEVAAGQIVRVHAVASQTFRPECPDCPPDQEEVPCIRTINGIGPDDQGNFQLLAGTCVELQPIGNGLELRDTCAQPCCGCPELEAITEDLQRAGQVLATLQSRLSNLEAEARKANMVILNDLNKTFCGDPCNDEDSSPPA